jgi:hypothetical protein
MHIAADKWQTKSKRRFCPTSVLSYTMLAAPSNLVVRHVSMKKNIPRVIGKSFDARVAEENNLSAHTDTRGRD